MNVYLWIIFLIIVILRLAALKKSKDNERQLLVEGAVIHGKHVSTAIAIVHFIFYFAAFFEGIARKTPFDKYSFIGLLLIIFSFVMLLIVIKTLGKYWTVKLIIAQNHIINRHWIFRYIKHPNYYLNIIPELIGVALLFHAITTFVILFPIYCLLLWLRINQENKLLSSINN